MFEGFHVSNGFKIVRGNALAETALAAAKYPASASFVDVAGYKWVTILIHLGTIHASDTPAFQVESSTAANGTPVDNTGLLHECAADDDGEFIVFHVDPTFLTSGHQFLTVDVTDVTNGSYGDIIYLLYGNTQPVTQNATVPAASVYSLPSVA